LGALLCQILGTLVKKNPPQVGKCKNFEMHNSESPHISQGSSNPLGEADDKWIKLALFLQKYNPPRIVIHLARVMDERASV